MFDLMPFDRHTRAMQRFDPFRDFEEMERNFFQPENAMMNPFHTDVIDNGDSYILDCELPGFNKEDIQLSVKNDCLTICAERKYDENEEKPNYIKRERYYGSYCRSFDVSGVDVDEIKASYNNGVLDLVLPKKKETVPDQKTIEIQ